MSLQNEPLGPTMHGVDEKSPATERWSFWRAGLLLTTSAALGGIAVAIWNRRTLARMRQESLLPYKADGEQGQASPFPGEDAVD